MVDQDRIRDFIRFCKKDLGIKKIPIIHLLLKRPAGVTTGGYIPGGDIICIIKNRHLVDILRSIAHELVHHWQWENGRIKGTVQNIGGEIEDEANAIAGQLIKKYAKDGNDNIYEQIDYNMKTSELKKLIKEEIQNVINANKAEYNIPVASKDQLIPGEKYLYKGSIKGEEVELEAILQFVTPGAAYLSVITPGKYSRMQLTQNYMLLNEPPTEITLFKK